MRTWLVIILAIMLQIPACFAQEAAPVPSPWHYKDYTIKVIPGKTKYSMQDLQITRQDTILTRLSYFSFVLPNDHFPVRDITGSGHKEISIVENCLTTEGLPCDELYLYELEPSFKLLGHFTIDDDETQAIRYTKSGLRITAVGIGFCGASKFECEETDGGIGYLNYYVTYKNGKFVLDTDYMKKPPYDSAYIKHVTDDIQKIAATPKLSDEEKLFQNHNDTEIQAFKFFYDGNGQQAENLIDTLYIGSTAEKKAAFKEVVRAICIPPYGADIAAMSQMTCPAKH